MSSASADIEGRWPIPPDWNWRRAKDFAKVVGGGTPKNAKDSANYAEDGTPWITPADLSGYSQPTIGGGARSLSETGFGRSSAKLLPAGTVLVSSRAPVGYCAVASNDVSTNQGFRSLVLDGSVDPFFLRYYVLASRGYLEDNASGTTFKELPGKVLEQLLFPIPPIETQKRIVARIDELFTELDDGESALERARDDLETYRKSLLKAAVTGELTADWRAANPSQETGEQLLRRILADRKASWEADPKNKGKRYKQPSQPDLESVPPLPADWTWCSLEQLSSPIPHSISDGPFGSNLKSEHYRDEGPRVIRLQNIGKRGEFVDAKAHIAVHHFETLERHHVRPGDLVVAILGEPLPKAMIVPDDFGSGLVKADCIKVRLADDGLTPFVWSVLNSPMAHSLMSHRVKGVGRPRIGMAQIKSMPIPLPPLTEITEIAERLANGLKQAADGEGKISDYLRLSECARHSILSTAFKGELGQ